MSKYTDNQSLFVSIHESNKFKTMEKIVWKIGHVNGPEYIVPSEFVFDVSIPKLLHCVYSPKNRKYLKAAALHDHMLVNGWDRITAGAEFHNALKADGVGAFNRIIFWLSVSFWKYSK